MISVLNCIIAILICPIICDAKISINITVASRHEDVKINYSGYDDKMITEKEINLFNLTNENLNEGFRVELGKVPNDIFLKNPTPYHDLFIKNKWQETKIKLKIKSAKVIDIINRDVIVKSYEHINNATNRLQVKIDMHDNIENIINFSWPEDSLPVDKILYDLNLDFKYGTYRTEIKWRKDRFKSVFLPFGAQDQFTTIIEPGQTIMAKLLAVKTILLVEVVYKAYLFGNVVGNYVGLYGKHHFWAPALYDIMKAADLKNDYETKYMIEIRCYINPKLVILDKLSGEIIGPSMRKKPLMKIFKNKTTKYVVYLKRQIKAKEMNHL